MKQPLTIEFFHDAVCGWCFNISPRLRALASELPITVHHRSFVLQDSPARMVEVFCSMHRAKVTILEHWKACQTASDAPELFSIESMRKAPFDYPHGLPAALACKAAEQMGGQGAHWDMFDALQRAHITQARNIANTGVLAEIAGRLGLDRNAFAAASAGPACRKAVEADRKEARRMQVSSVPTLIIRETGQRLVNGPTKDLRAQITAALRLAALTKRKSGSQRNDHPCKFA